MAIPIEEFLNIGEKEAKPLAHAIGEEASNISRYYHGSPHKIAVGDYLRPGVKQPNFGGGSFFWEVNPDRSNRVFFVEDPDIAEHYGRRIAQRGNRSKFFLYEVQPHGFVDTDDIDPKSLMAPSAKILSRTKLTTSDTPVFKETLEELKNKLSHFYSLPEMSWSDVRQLYTTMHKETELEAGRAVSLRRRPSSARIGNMRYQQSEM